MKLVKLVQLNNLHYNENRDPQVYRRPINKDFSLKAWLDGNGSAEAKLAVEGEVVCEGSVNLPGKFNCSFNYDTPGTRMATLTITGNGETYEQNIRIDVDAHAKIG